MKTTSWIGAALGALLLVTIDARAEEVRVLAAGAVQKAIQELAAAFEARTPHRVAVTFDTVGALRDKVLAGESPHFVLLSASGLNALAQKDRLLAGSRRDLGRTGVGLAAPRDAPPADISTPEKLKAALLAAPSIAHADPARGATAGTHFRSVLARLGIEQELAGRITVLPFGGEVVARTADGHFSIGVSQATEIVPNPKLRFLGFLPAELQLWTIYGVAGVAPPNAAATAFQELLTGPDGNAAFKRIGFEP